jgi:Glycosyltransferase family 87
MAILTRRPPLWIWFALLLAVAIYIGQRGRRDFWDYEVIRTAGVRAVAAEPLYREADRHYQFKYWPISAVAMMPLSLMSMATGKIVWYLFAVTLMIVFIDRSASAMPHRRHAATLLAGLALLLTGRFYVKELINGQSNLPMAVLVIFALIAAQRGRARLCAVLIGLASFIKPYALILVPWLAVEFGWVAVLDALAVIAGGLLLPALLYGWRGNLALLADWRRTVSDTTAPNLLFAENISTATMWAKWIGPSHAASVLATATSLVLLGIGALLVVLRRRAESPAYLEIGALMLLVPLVSPQGWDYVLLLATPAFICLIDRWGDLSLGWKAFAAVSIFVVSFTIYDLVGRTLYLLAMATSVVSVGAIALLLCLLHLRWRRLA